MHGSGIGTRTACLHISVGVGTFVVGSPPLTCTIRLPYMTNGLRPSRIVDRVRVSCVINVCGKRPGNQTN